MFNSASGEVLAPEVQAGPHQIFALSMKALKCKTLGVLAMLVCQGREATATNTRITKIKLLSQSCWSNHKNAHCTLLRNAQQYHVCQAQSEKLLQVCEVLVVLLKPLLKTIVSCIVKNCGLSFGGRKCQGSSL